MKHLSWLFIVLLTISIINYPNPFNPKSGEIATFECIADTTLEASLYIYDMSARLVLQKAFNLSAGINKTAWNGYNEANELAGSGVYLYRMIDNSAKNAIARGKIWVINR